MSKCKASKLFTSNKVNLILKFFDVLKVALIFGQIVSFSNWTFPKIETNSKKWQTDISVVVDGATVT